MFKKHLLNFGCKNWYFFGRLENFTTASFSGQREHGAVAVSGRVFGLFCWVWVDEFIIFGHCLLIKTELKIVEFVILFGK